jgi:hypothetical protein
MLEVESYRLFIMDRNGHIVGASEFVCADDVEAQAVVHPQIDGRPMELWSLDRVVRKYPATPSRPSSTP